jgi:hypothetical protein
MTDSVEIQKIETLPSYFSDSSVINLSQDKLKKIGEKCRKRFEELKQARASSHYEDEHQADFDSYHLIAPKKILPHKGFPNLACPLARIGVDTFHANVMFTFGGQNGHFQVLPDFLSKSHLDVAQRAAEYMTYVLNYEADLYDAFDKADMDAEKYENGFLKPSYVKDEVWETRRVTTEEFVPEVDEATGAVTRKSVKKHKTERVKRTVFDGIKVKRVSPECVLASSFFETVDEAVEKDFVFEYHNYNMRYVEEMSVTADKDYEPFFSPSQVKKIKTIVQSAVLSNLEKNKQEYDGNQVEALVELQPVELAEAHFREDVNDDGLAEKVAVVFETSTGTVLRATFAKCRLVKISPRPIDGRWDSESIRRATAPLLLEWEAIHNQRVYKGMWENLPLLFYKAGGRFNPQVQTLMPGKAYPVDDPNSINVPQLGQVGMSYFNEERLIMDYFDRVLALGDVIQGVSGGKDVTATNTIHSQQRAGIRLATPMNRIAMALEKLMDHIWDLNRQCAPTMKEYRVVGTGDNTVPVFSKISGSDFDSQLSFKLNMATMYDVQMLRDSALLNYKTFISNPLFLNNPAAFYYLTTDTMRAVGLKIPLPRPEQAKARSPFIEHDMIREGKEVEPVVGEDMDEHLTAHKAFMETEEFQNWPQEAQQALLVHYDKTTIQKKTFEAANLNQSGIFEGMPGGGLPGQAGMTANRNPTQEFNTMRVGETGPSMRQQARNGMMGEQNA